MQGVALKKTLPLISSRQMKKIFLDSRKVVSTLVDVSTAAAEANDEDDDNGDKYNYNENDDKNNPPQRSRMRCHRC